MSKAKELDAKYKTLLSKNEINSTERKATFFAQLEHESNLKPIGENLNYSKDKLLVIFPKYFNATTAAEFARKPEMIANRVYANKMGNLDEKSGDGWNYRGRGFIQITGKNNYKVLSDATKIDYLNQPDLLLNEADAMISALWYWKANNLNKFADTQNVLGATKRINGGTNGLADKKKKSDKYMIEFKV